MFFVFLFFAFCTSLCLLNAFFLFYVLPMWACLGKGEIVGDGGDVYIRYGTVLCSMPYHVYGRRCLASLGGKSKSQDCTWWGEKEGINHHLSSRGAAL